MPNLLHDAALFVGLCAGVAPASADAATHGTNPLASCTGSGGAKLSRHLSTQACEAAFEDAQRKGLAWVTHELGRIGWAAALLASAFTTPAMAADASLYAPWRNGPPQSPTFFPLAVWWQAPTVTGHSGSYATEADAVAGMKLNIFLGIGSPWPESFGADNGELEAIKANNLYVIGGIATPYNEDSSAQSVASVLALASSIGATKNVIGYVAGDEPNCQTGAMQLVPTVVAGINGYDPTRIVSYNFTAWMLENPSWIQPACLTASFAALDAVSFSSFDLYPLTSPWVRYSGSDFESVSQDSLYTQGMATAVLLHDKPANQPSWVYVESGSDNFGFSGQNNVFAGGVSAGSSTLTNASGWSSFTKTWVGLTVSGTGIPANTTISGIIDATHASLSTTATASSANENITVTGGAVATSDCVASANLCVVNGNEYRPTPEQVNAEVWMTLINGANGIEYFCHDSKSYSFCLGDVNGGPAAQTTQTNITYINKTVLRFARELNAPTTGICSMQQFNYSNAAQSTTTTCTDGILTMSTANAAVPGMAMVKQVNGVTWLFAQSDRRSSAGANFTYALTGLGGKTATIAYDSDDHYDHANSKLHAQFTLNGSGQFSDVLGANNDHYQVKIYKIQ